METFHLFQRDTVHTSFLSKLFILHWFFVRQPLFTTYSIIAKQQHRTQYVFTGKAAVNGLFRLYHAPLKEALSFFINMHSK